MNKLTKDQISNIVSKSKPALLPMEKSGLEGYMIVGAPTIIWGNQLDNAFVLNTPSKLQKLELLKQYCDRVIVRDTFSEEKIERVVRLMKGRAFDFAKTVEVDAPVHSSHYGFEMPGYEGNFLREVESSPGHYEIRYYMEVFKEID